MKQMDLLDAVNEASVEADKEPVTSKEPHVFTVSEINKAIRRRLESEFSPIWIKGEISNFKAHSSGHLYFSLKDSKAQINCVMFRGFNSKLRFRPESGMEVVIRGKVTVYEPRGNYQIFCETMDPVGAGALQMAYEQLKKKLQAEGLFDSARKRELPALPQHIALVTSPTGAAVRDMLNVLGRRFRGVSLTVVPVLVQGERAAESIVFGLQQVNQMKDVDVVICGRGGGSIEDLWCFNEEIVARQIADMKVPIVSAVGHEVDFTIADFVADLRAPTPSAAAELVVKNAADLIDQVQGLTGKLVTLWQRDFLGWRRQVDYLSRRLVDPQRKLQELSQRCDELVQRLEVTIGYKISHQRQHLSLVSQKLSSPLQRHVEAQRARLNRLMSLLDSLSPLKVVDRGYTLTTKGKNVIKDVAQVRVGDELNIRFAKGEALVEVKEVRSGDGL